MPHRYPHREITLKQTLETRWPRKPVPPKTVTFRGAIVLFLAMPS
jgi:hypothetical protein